MIKFPIAITFIKPRVLAKVATPEVMKRMLDENGLHIWNIIPSNLKSNLIELAHNMIVHRVKVDSGYVVDMPVEFQTLDLFKKLLPLLTKGDINYVLNYTKIGKEPEFKKFVSDNNFI